MVSFPSWLADGINLVYDDDKEVAEWPILLPVFVWLLEVGTQVLLRLSKELADDFWPID